MKQMILLLIVSIALTACGTQNTATAEDVSIDFAIEPNPPAVGDAILLITLTNSNDATIDDATITVHGNMDHEGMIPVDAETSNSSNGVYTVPFEWSMGGNWILNVTATLPDNRGVVTAQFETSVGAISQGSIINQIGTSSDSSIVIRYESDDDPAIAGDAKVTVIVLGTDGLPIDDATVIFHATMPEHAMLPIDAEITEASSGRYVIPIRWTMAGDWLVDITVTQVDGTEITETFEQTVVVPE